MISTSQYMNRKYEKKLAKLLSRGIRTEYRNALYGKWDEQSTFWSNYKAPSMKERD